MCGLASLSHLPDNMISDSENQMPGLLAGSSPHSTLALRTKVTLATTCCKARRGPQAVLQRGLPRLRCLVAALPRARRLQVLERLSVQLRRTLISYMEATHLAASSRSAEAVYNGVSKELSAAHPPDVEAKRPSKVKKSIGGGQRSLKANGGVYTFRGSSGLFHVARISIDCIAIASGCYRSYAEAQRLCNLLGRLRESMPRSAARPHWMTEVGHAARDSSDDGHRGNWLLAAFTRGVTPGKVSLPAELADLHHGVWRFRATVDARRWIGRTVSSRQVSSIAEALQLRRWLDGLRRQGWEALRAGWIHCMQEPRNSSRFGRLARSKAVAEAQAGACEGLAAQHWRVQKAHAAAVTKSLREYRRQQRLQQRLERLHSTEDARALRTEERIARLSPRLERAVAALEKRIRPCRRIPIAEPCKRLKMAELCQ